MTLKVRRFIVLLMAISMVAPGLAQAQKNDEIARMLNAGFDLLEQGNYSQAQKVYEEVLKKDPTQPLALNNLAAIMVKHGNYEQALVLLHRALPRAQGFKVAANRVCNVDSVCAAHRISEKQFGSEDLDRVVRTNILMVQMARAAKQGAK
jgi:tetratricopeptide (TPR) repeat protein